MLDFIKEVAEPKSDLRLLRAKYIEPDVIFAVHFLIVTEDDFWHSHPYMIKQLQESYPNLRPRLIEWSTHDPETYDMLAP